MLDITTNNLTFKIMEKNLHECCETIQQEEKQINKNIDDLKEEILRELNQSKKEKRKINWASTTVTIVLVILALTSLAQAVQTANIWRKVQSGAISSGNASTASNSAPLPSSIENLPSMVGGC